MKLPLQVVLFLLLDIITLEVNAKIVTRAVLRHEVSDDLDWEPHWSGRQEVWALVPGQVSVLGPSLTLEC